MPALESWLVAGTRAPAGNVEIGGGAWANSV